MESSRKRSLRHAPATPVSILEVDLTGRRAAHGMGVVTINTDFERIAEVGPLIVRRLKTEFRLGGAAEPAAATRAAMAHA